jgi:predicted nucleotidyltransferase
MPTNISHLPDLPQSEILEAIATELWAATEIRAIWLGGSLARGGGDRFSDIDLRLFVTDASFSESELPEAAMILRRSTVVHLPLIFPNGILHHLMLDSGMIIDLLIHQESSEPSNEARLILAVKDEALHAKLLHGVDPGPPVFTAATPETIERLLATFWISELKHLKVIYRGLGLVAWQGEHFIRQEVLKLYYIAATGSDYGYATGSIHVMSPVVTAIQNAFGNDVLAVLGTPRRTIAELLTHARELQDTVATLGRMLCTRHEASYPEAAEATVRRCWKEFQL